MYLPKLFAEADPARLHALIEAHGFGTLIAPGAGEPEIAHLPFVLDRSRGERGTLSAHVARSNPIWRAFDGAAPVTAIFQGPHGYVSPGWYSSRDDVPTWNYAVVHVHGAPRLLTQDEEVDDVLRRLASVYEAGMPRPWSLAELTPSLLAELRQAIVAFELPIARMVGKFKLSQNRRAEDRDGAIHGLEARGRPEDVELARWMRRARS